MNKKLILVLIVVLSVASASFVTTTSASATDLSFSLANTRYVKAADFWTVDVPCIGGSGSYSYSCDLPDGWKLENNLFKIPSSASLNYNYEYVSRCKVRDNTYGSILERALTFKCTANGYIVSDFDYFYGQTSYSTGSLGSISGLDILKRLSTLSGSVSGGSISGGSYTGGSFGGGSYTGGSFGGGSFGGIINSNGGGYYSGLPSWSNVDVLIKNGNMAEILSLIQKVVSSTSIKCDAKTAYLNDLLGRVCAAIQIKQESIFQLKALIEGVIVQIQKLTVQISTLRSEQASLDIAGLKSKLNLLLSQLQAAYAEYNTCVSSTGDYDKELSSLRIELKELQEKVRTLQVELDACIYRLSQINSDISALELKLTQLKAERVQVEAKISDLRVVIVQRTDRIKVVKVRIDWLCVKIEEVKKNCSSVKVRYEKLEIDIKNLQNQISQSEARYKAIDERIATINIEIERLRGVVSSYELKLKAVTQCIENLNSTIKQIKQTITYIHYNCNDCPNVVVVDIGVDPFFKFGRFDWFSYMSKCYGAPQNQIQISFPNITVEIKTINIFSPVFQGNYGSCFGDQIKSKGSNWESQNSFGFDNDFQCSANVDNVAVKKGKIKTINNKYVDVDCEDGTKARLKLGSCSRFEGNGKDFVPKVGNNIHWKGSKNVDSSFNLHSCACY